ncbi:MAG: DMT family transporter [Vibrio sp.]
MLTSSINGRFGKFIFIEPLLLLVAFFWGTSYGLTKEALLYAPIFVFMLLRFSLTFFLMLPILINDFRLGLNKDWKTAIPTGVILSAIFFFEVFGVSKTTASNAAFLISLSVIFTAFAERLINKKKVSSALYFLTLVSVIGVFMLTWNFEKSYKLNEGDYLILCAALLRALMVTVTKRVSEGKVISTSSMTALQSFIVAVVSGVMAISFLPVSEIGLPLDMNFWWIIFYLVLFCTLFAFYVQNYAVRKTSPTRVSILMGSEPFFGALFAVVWLQESLSIIQLIGGILIVTCVLVTSVRVSI